MLCITLIQIGLVNRELDQRQHSNILNPIQVASYQTLCSQKQSDQILIHSRKWDVWHL